MYAWSVASAQSERGPVDYQLKEELMLQPPFDMTLDRVRTGINAFRSCQPSRPAAPSLLSATLHCCVHLLLCRACCACIRASSPGMQFSCGQG